MKDYLFVSVTAVIFLTFCQIILPVNSMKSVTKMVIGLIFVSILSMPIIQLLSGNANFNYQFEFDKSYYYYLDEIENSTIKIEVENILKKYDYNSYEILIEEENENKNLKILLKSVINDSQNHINNIEEIKSEITKKCLGTIKGVEILIE